MIFRRLLYGLLLFSTGAWAQVNKYSSILDDSSELVYGPSTTFIVYESDLLYNSDTTHQIDTALAGLENFTFVDENRHLYQDLGNLGSAVNPIFYPLSNNIGRKSGFNAYTPYIQTPDKQKYFNTKSPFIDLQTVLGGRGRSYVSVDFTQNVNPNWNFGFSVSRVTADKQLGAQLTEGDRHVVNSQLNLYSYFQHPEIDYKVAGYINYYTRNVDEIGGIFTTDSSTTADKFQYRDAALLLNDATSSENVFHIHAYQEYALFEQFQLYHRLDRKTQNLSYRDFADGAGGVYDTYRDFYNTFFFDADSTYERSNFREFTNEVGLKGSLGAVYYRFYAKNRVINHEYLFINPFETVIENYIGGESRFKWKDKFQVRVQGEVLQSGEYNLKGNLSSSLLEASYQSVLYKQSNLAQRFFNNHYSWENNFESGFSNELKGKVKLKYKNLLFHPAASIITHNNLVYFDTLGISRQTSAAALLTRLGGNLNYHFWTNKEKKEGFRIENEFYYSITSGGASDVLRVPELLYNGRIYWDGKWFEDALPTQIGFNLHGKSSYFVHGFDPVSQQFYLQNRQGSKDFLTADFFINMQIEKLFVFFKVTYANQPAEDGYFTSYLYPGQSRVLDFGVRWLFFD